LLTGNNTSSNSSLNPHSTMKLLRLFIKLCKFNFCEIEKMLIFIFFSDLIPLQNKKYKFFSCKTFISLIIWFCIPIGLFTISIYLQYVSSYEVIEYNPVILASTVTVILNIVALTLFIPGLLANLVEKSEIDLDVSKYSKKWVALYFIIFLTSTVLGIFRSDMKENMIYFTAATLFCQIMIAMLLVAYFITTNLVCTSFIEEATDLSKEKDEAETVLCSIHLVKKIRILKSGFSPLNFCILTNYTTCMIVCAYSGFYYLKLRQYFLFLSFSISVVMFLLVIYLYKNFLVENDKFFEY